MKILNRWYIDFYWGWGPGGSIGIEIVPRPYCVLITFMLYPRQLVVQWFWGPIDRSLR